MPGASGHGAPSGDVSSLAARVIAGEFGNGTERMFLLGDAYEVVQARVNEILGRADAPDVDVDEMARAVIRGDYGNGEERQRRRETHYERRHVMHHRPFGGAPPPSDSVSDAGTRRLFSAPWLTQACHKDGPRLPHLNCGGSGVPVMPVPLAG